MNEDFYNGSDLYARCGAPSRFLFDPPSYLIDSPRGRDILPACHNEDSAPLQHLDLPSSVECLIVGGGLAAVTMASYLFHESIEFAICDPNITLASRFLGLADSSD